MKLFQVLCSLGFLATVTAAASTEKPVVESNKLRRVILRSELIAKAKTLEDFAYSTPKRNRQIGTPGHDATTNWIFDTIKQYRDYYDVYLQGYKMLLNVDANLTVDGKAIEVYSLGMSPSGKAKGPLFHIPNLACNKTDFPADLTGKIALVSRSYTCQSAIQVAYAGAANALGVIIFNNKDAPYTSMNGKSLQKVSTPEGPYVPTGGITKPDGEALVARLDAGEEIIGDLSTLTENKTTYNVIAQTKDGDQNDILHVGGHTDSVAPGPGLNDNGSGTITLLEVAIQLTKFTVKNAVRFTWWTAEESGLLGSTYYVAHLNQTEINKIRISLNFDMLASPNYIYAVYDGDGSAYGKSGPPGSAEAEKLFQDYFTKEAHQNFTQIEFDGRSDYGPFLDVGIAAGGIDTGAEGIKTAEEVAEFGGTAGVAYDINYHRPGDNFTNLNVEAWIQTSKAVAHAIGTYARSFESLPPKDLSLAHKREMLRRRESGEAGLGVGNPGRTFYWAVPNPHEVTQSFRLVH